MSTAAEPKTCLQCGQLLGGLAPAGVCSRCLLLTGLDETNGAGLEQTKDRSEPRRDSDLPRRFGDYELLEEIARGGMGIVYKARQLSLDRMVAVKMLLFGQYTSEEFIHRFRIEASAAASLQHPNIVAIHEVGVQQGQHYFAMDLVDGPNLAQFIREQPLPAKRAAAYVKAIAEAIQFAHQRRILHRDLKPSNILIDSNDQPRITDFGLAKRFGVPASAGGAQADFTGTDRSNALPAEAGTPNLFDTLTVTGQMLGSPSYMPPEQASVQHGRIGPHSDVYSMGAILYHALVGRPPFVGETLADTLQQVLHNEPIAPRLLNPAVPGDLETICLKCLEREPAKRYAAAQELADELGRFLRDEPIHARPVTRSERAWRWCRRNPPLAAASALAIAFLLVLGIGSPLVAYRINQARKSESAETLKARRNSYAADISTAQGAIEEGDMGRARALLQQHVPLPGEPDDLRGFEWRYLAGLLNADESAPIATNTWVDRYLCLSPDGQLLGAGSWLWSTTSRAKVFLGVDSIALAFAPSGQALLFRRLGMFLRRDLATKRETMLLEHERVAAIAFSRSGRWMATGTEKGLRLWDTTTWQVVNSATNATFDEWSKLDPDLYPFNYFSAKGLAFSPDDRLLIVASGYPHRSELSCWKIPSLERVPIPANSVDDAACVVFAPNGREFLTGNWDGDVRFWDTSTLTEIQARRLPNAHRSWIADMAFLPGTQKLVTAGADRCIHIWDLETRGTPIKLRGHTLEIQAMALSSDGKIIYTSSADRTIKQWMAALPVSNDESLSHFGSPLLPAGISEDGGLLATVSEKAVHFWHILDTKVTEEVPLRVELSGLGKIPLNWGRSEGMTVVSPNRKWLAIGRSRDVIQILDLSSGAKRRLLEGGTTTDQYLNFSPDGALLVAMRSADRVAVFETATWREIALIKTPGKPNPVFPFFFAARAHVLAVAGSQSVLLWDTFAHRLIKEIRPENLRTKELISFSISADAAMLAMGHSDDTFTLHDCKTGSQIASVPSHVSGVEWLSFSPDGKTLATSSGRWVRLWNVATGRAMFPLELSSMAIFVAFTPDGSGLLTAETSGITRLWHAPSFERIQSFDRQKAASSHARSVSSLNKRRIIGCWTAYRDAN